MRTGESGIRAGKRSVKKKAGAVLASFARKSEMGVGPWPPFSLRKEEGIDS